MKSRHFFPMRKCSGVNQHISPGYVTVKCWSLKFNLGSDFKTLQEATIMAHLTTGNVEGDLIYVNELSKYEWLCRLLIPTGAEQSPSGYSFCHRESTACIPDGVAQHSGTCQPGCLRDCVRHSSKAPRDSEWMDSVSKKTVCYIKLEGFVIICYGLSWHLKCLVILWTFNISLRNSMYYLYYQNL